MRLVIVLIVCLLGYTTTIQADDHTSNQLPTEEFDSADFAEFFAVRLCPNEYLACIDMPKDTCLDKARLATSNCQLPELPTGRVSTPEEAQALQDWGACSIATFFDPEEGVPIDIECADILAEAFKQEFGP